MAAVLSMLLPKREDFVVTEGKRSCTNTREAEVGWWDRDKERKDEDDGANKTMTQCNDTQARPSSAKQSLFLFFVF
jgi:hypothetical protein